MQDASRKHLPSEDSFCYLARSVFQMKSSRGEQELGARGEEQTSASSGWRLLLLWHKKLVL